MKKNFIFLLLVILIFSSFKPNRSNTVKGYIKSYGNVPLNYPVIETEDSVIIKILDGKYSKSELLEYQGHLIEVTGLLTKDKIGKNIEYYIDIDDIQILK